jgi:hypothetical protein
LDRLFVFGVFLSEETWDFGLAKVQTQASWEAAQAQMVPI